MCEASPYKQRSETPKTQQSVAAVFSRATPYDKSGQGWKDITYTVAFYIGKDVADLLSWKARLKKKQLKTLDPKYEVWKAISLTLLLFFLSFVNFKSVHKMQMSI